MLPRPPSPIPSSPQPQVVFYTAGRVGLGPSSRAAERRCALVPSHRRRGCPGMMPAPPIEPLTRQRADRAFSSRRSRSASMPDKKPRLLFLPRAGQHGRFRPSRGAAPAHRLASLERVSRRDAQGPAWRGRRGGQGRQRPEEPCWVSSNWSDWPLVINSQSSDPGHETVDYTPADRRRPKFAAGELLMVQSHYVNATTQVTPDSGEAWLNFEYMPAADVKSELRHLLRHQPEPAHLPRRDQVLREGLPLWSPRHRRRCQQPTSTAAAPAFRCTPGTKPTAKAHSFTTTPRGIR